MRGRFDNLVADNALIRKAFRLEENHLTLGGNVTLLDEDGVIYAADAGGSSRNVTLPARAAGNDGQVRMIVNLSTAGENLVIKNSGGSTLLTLPSGAVGMVVGTGTAEDPATRAWIAVPIGGEDLAIADDLAVTGDLTVTGATVLNGNVVLGNATGDLVGAYGFTTGQPTSGDQAALPVTTMTSIVLSYSTSTTGAFFFTNSTQLDNLVAFYNLMAARTVAITTLANRLRADLVSTGWIKGS